MILRRDPVYVWIFTLMTLAIVAVVGVTVYALAQWSIDPRTKYAVTAIYSAGIVMVGTWTLITLAAIPDPEIFRPRVWTTAPDEPRILPLLPPDGYNQLVVPGPINWPNVTRGRIYGAIEAARKCKRVSVRLLMAESDLTQIEAGIFRDWLARQEVGETTARGDLIITDMDQLDRLSPIAREFSNRKPRVKQLQNGQYRQYGGNR